MKKAYIRRTPEPSFEASEIASPAALSGAVPPTAAEFLGWPSTTNPWLRLAFIHDALVRNLNLPEEKRWRVTKIDLAAALGIESKSIQRDLTFMLDKLGAPIVWDNTLHSYAYSESVPATFVDCIEMLRRRKEAQGVAPSAPAGPRPSQHYQGRKVKQTGFERMEQIHRLLLPGRPMTGPQLASKTGSSVCMINRDIAYMRFQLGLPITFRPELGAYVFSGSVAADQVREEETSPQS